MLTVCAECLRLSQAKTLSILVGAAMRVQRISLAPIGRAMIGTAKHQIKRCWRFCANQRVETADAMRGIGARLLNKRKKKLLVALDGVDIKGFQTLMASAVLKGRSVPICWASTTHHVFDDHRGVYGSPRVFKALDAAGVACCENTAARLMRENGLFSCIKRKFRVCTTDSDHDHPVAPNRLDRRFTWDQPDQAWATDITYLATEEGWLYLAVVIDLCSRTIVGWAAANHLRAELCTAALENAIATRRPSPGLLHHSDRGVQYACAAYQSLLSKHEMVCSMSRRGNCWDNAAAESFFKSLKVYQTKWATHEEARSALFEWIEVFYNRKRLHSSLGYQSPATYEAQFN